MIYRQDEMLALDPVNSSSSSSSSSFVSSSRINSCEDDVCSSPELDVVSFTPGPQSSSSSADDPNNQKRYFCQRCLNHKLEFPRKGHKPFCRYSMCHCDDCMMVEYRRRLNNQLSQRRLDPEQTSGKRTEVGKKIRDPKCARCSAHGEKQALRGHKKALCPYLKCGCHLCNLVENRRMLMAKQIKLRRDQQKARKAQQQSGADIVSADNNNNRNNNTKGGQLAAIKSQLKNISQNTSATKAFKDEVFARPLAISSERKRSYESMLEGERIGGSRSLAGSVSSYSNNSSPTLGSSELPVLLGSQCSLSSATTVSGTSIITPDLSTAISPMLLPPSLLYQQLCLRSQQKETLDNGFVLQLNNQNETNNMSHMTTGNVTAAAPLQSPLSVTGSPLVLPTTAPSVTLGGQQLSTLNSLNLLNSTSTAATTTNSMSFGEPVTTTAANIKAIDALNVHDAQKQLSHSLLLANTLTPRMSTVGTASTPLFNSFAASAGNNVSEGNCSLMMNALNFINISSLNGSPKTEAASDALSRVFIERLTAILTASANGGTNYSNDDVVKHMNHHNALLSLPASQNSPSSQQLDSSMMNSSLANFLLQYTTALANQNDNNIVEQQQQPRGTALLLN